MAAAANLTNAFARIGERFEARTGIRAVFSFGSTAQLARQIEEGAPFDVFAAADTEHVADLDRKGLLAPGTREVYARGVLALWSPPHVRNPLRRLEDLRSADVRFVAIANPKLAPYGEAAVDALKRASLWTDIQPKVVYAGNINAARQLGSSGNADAVFTAYSLVAAEGGSTIKVDPALHKPLDQALGILAPSGRRDEAKRFVEFLLRGEGRAMLQESGYGDPRP